MTRALALRENGHKRITKAELIQENWQLRESYAFLEENIAELELALDDEGWSKMSFESRREFSTEGLRRIINLCRLNYLKNPLVRRAVEIQRYYVFAQGVTIQARDPERDKIVQAFLTDQKNVVEFTGHEARSLKEVTLETEANLFFVFFTDTAGTTRVRTIPVDDIIAGEIICNPDDRKEPWFYKRVWAEMKLDLATGRITPDTRTAYYPDFRLEKTGKLAIDKIGEHQVHWDQPICHVKVGGLEHMRFGIPELYPSIDWARAIKEDLEDYATIKRAFARFAWNLTLKGGAKTIAAAKARLGTNLGADVNSGIDTNPTPSVGAAWIASEAAKLAPVKTAGMQPTPEEGMRLWYMFSAAVGIPETMIAGDADSGNLATAKTLDRPTELKFKDRQTFWADVYRDILGFVIRKAAGEQQQNTPAAPRGEITPSEDDPETTVDETIDIIWPPILEQDPKAWVDAIVSAGTLDGKTESQLFPPKELARLLMSAVGVENIEELLTMMFPSDANAVAPYEQPPTPTELAQQKADALAQKNDGDTAPVTEALRELMSTFEAVIERRRERESSDAIALVEAATALRELAEQKRTVSGMAISEEQKSTALLRLTGLSTQISEAINELAAVPAEDPRQRELEEQLARLRTESAREIQELREHVDGMQPTVNVLPAPPTPITFAPKIEIPPAAPPIVPIVIEPAAVTVDHHDHHPRKTRTRVTKSEADGTPTESETEVVEED